MKRRNTLLAFALITTMALTACSGGGGNAGSGNAAGGNAAGGNAASGDTAGSSAAETPAKAKAVSLKLAHTQSTDHPVHKSLEKFAELVNEKTNGEVTVEIFANGVLGDERKYIESLQTGLLDMAKVSIYSMENFEKLYSVFTIPYAFEGMDHGRKFMNSEKMEDFYTSTIDSLDIRGLTWYNSGGRNYYARDKAILTPDDMKGMVMRVQSSQIQIKTVETLGGSATPVDWGELYTALQQGVVDGADNGIVAFADNNLCEVVKNFSFTEHILSPDILLIKNSVLEKLTPEQQTAVKEAARESTAYHDEIWGAAEQAAIDKSKAAGVNIYYPELAPFAEALKPLQEELIENEQVAEYLKIIDDMK